MDGVTHAPEGVLCSISIDGSDFPEDQKSRSIIVTFA